MSSATQAMNAADSPRHSPAEGASLFQSISACPMCGAEGARVIRRETNRFIAHDESERKFFAPYTVTVALRQCSECSFAYLDQLPARAEFYERLYRLNRYDYEYEFNHHGKRSIYAELKKQILRHGARGSLLDIGCWCGTLLEAMSDSFQVIGCELSEPAAQFARSRGFDVRIAPFQEAGFAPASFDVITIVDVLEHLTEPRAVLEKIRDLLKPGGILYIKVPNVAGQIRKQDLLQRLRLSREGVCSNFVHINHFGHHSLSRGLSQLGFEVLECGFTKAEVWDLSVRRPWAEQSRKRVVNLVRNLGTSATSLVSRLTPINIGLNIYVIARK
jgi:2-polyprenyl-3-methyl-5-hydroxy-6-metoxy-1,4-benzoquinol methylase